MPQSIHFKNPARLAAAARRFAAHRNLTITVRDLDSERLVREPFSNPVHIVPDMAHHLWPAQRSAPGVGETLTLFGTIGRAALRDTVLQYGSCWVVDDSI